MKLTSPLSLIAAAAVLALHPVSSTQAQAFGGVACGGTQAPAEPPEDDDDFPPPLQQVSYSRARAAAVSASDPASTRASACSALVHDAPLLRQTLNHFQSWQTQQLVRLHQRRLIRQTTAQPTTPASPLSVHADTSSVGHRQDGQESTARLSAIGLTVGADYRLNERWVVGSSLGLSDSRIRWRGLNSRVDGDGVMGSVYASVSPTEQSYVSATATAGSTRYRLSSDLGGAVGASVDSSSRSRDHGLSLMAGLDLPLNQGPTVSPYARWDMVRSHLRSNDTAYSGLRGGSDRLSLGVQSLWAVPQTWGVLTPYARAELTRITHLGIRGASADAYNASTGAVPLPHPIKADRSIGQWALGVSGVLQHGLSLFADYEHGFADAGVSQWRFTAGLRSEL